MKNHNQTDVWDEDMLGIINTGMNIRSKYAQVLTKMIESGSSSPYALEVCAAYNLTEHQRVSLLSSTMSSFGNDKHISESKDLLSPNSKVQKRRYKICSLKRILFDNFVVLKNENLIEFVQTNELVPETRYILPRVHDNSFLVFFTPTKFKQRKMKHPIEWLFQYLVIFQVQYNDSCLQQFMDMEIPFTGATAPAHSGAQDKPHGENVIRLARMDRNYDLVEKFISAGFEEKLFTMMMRYKDSLRNPSPSILGKKRKIVTNDSIDVDHQEELSIVGSGSVIVPCKKKRAPVVVHTGLSESDTDSDSYDDDSSEEEDELVSLFDNLHTRFDDFVMYTEDVFCSATNFKRIFSNISHPDLDSVIKQFETYVQRAWLYKYFNSTHNSILDPKNTPMGISNYSIQNIKTTIKLRPATFQRLSYSFGNVNDYISFDNKTNEVVFDHSGVWLRSNFKIPQFKILQGCIEQMRANHLECKTTLYR